MPQDGKCPVKHEKCLTLAFTLGTMTRLGPSLRCWLKAQLMCYASNLKVRLYFEQDLLDFIEVLLCVLVAHV